MNADRAIALLLYVIIAIVLIAVLFRLLGVVL